VRRDGLGIYIYRENRQTWLAARTAVWLSSVAAHGSPEMPLDPDYAPCAQLARGPHAEVQAAYGDLVSRMRSPPAADARAPVARCSCMRGVSTAVENNKCAWSGETLVSHRYNGLG
jgi:hypothetical protein